MQYFKEDLQSLTLPSALALQWGAKKQKTSSEHNQHISDIQPGKKFVFRALKLSFLDYFYEKKQVEKGGFSLFLVIPNIFLGPSTTNGFVAFLNFVKTS